MDWLFYLFKSLIFIFQLYQMASKMETQTDDSDLKTETNIEK